MKLSALPKVVIAELEACPRNDCRVREAMGETGCNIASNSVLLECLACGQIWELESQGNHFTHWDKAGQPHVTAISWSIGSKWPKGESQCDSVGGFVIRKRFVDVAR